MKRTKKPDLGTQLKRHSKQEAKENLLDGNTETMISTGSTLLDLAISGTRKRGGGIPGGVMVEIFGPESSGKTVLLCEIGGAIQRKGGSLLFNDPEARLNKQFAEIFDIDMAEATLENSDTVKDMFLKMEKWKPETTNKINGILIDSLAALSTNMEMDNDEGDKMGMRRAKELSEGWRKFARRISNENYIVVASNQLRVKTDAVAFGEQFTTPGGKATAYYASIRLKVNKPSKIKKEINFKGKKIKTTTGVDTEIEVYKSSVDKPFRTANVIIDFNYGIDDIRANLQFLKSYSNDTIYSTGKTILDRSLEKSIEMVESDNLETELKNNVIDLWMDIQEKFESNRKKKIR
jgi:recombination protein RecA